MILLCNAHYSLVTKTSYVEGGEKKHSFPSRGREIGLLDLIPISSLLPSLQQPSNLEGH